jgi:hypothetical protein
LLLSGDEDGVGDRRDSAYDTDENDEHSERNGHSNGNGDGNSNNSSSSGDEGDEEFEEYRDRGIGGGGGGGSGRGAGWGSSKNNAGESYMDSLSPSSFGSSSSKGSQQSRQSKADSILAAINSSSMVDDNILIFRDGEWYSVTEEGEEVRFIPLEEVLIKEGKEGKESSSRGDRDGGGRESYGNDRDKGGR